MMVKVIVNLNNCTSSNFYDRLMLALLIHKEMKKMLCFINHYFTFIMNKKQKVNCKH